MTSDKFKMPLLIKFEMVPSAAKPMLTAFNGRMFSLLSKSMSQMFLIFSVVSDFALIKVTQVIVFLNHCTKMLSLEHQFGRLLKMVQNG